MKYAKITPNTIVTENQPTITEVVGKNQSRFTGMTVIRAAPSDIKKLTEYLRESGFVQDDWPLIAIMAFMFSLIPFGIGKHSGDMFLIGFTAFFLAAFWLFCWWKSRTKKLGMEEHKRKVYGLFMKKYGLKEYLLPYVGTLAYCGFNATHLLLPKKRAV